MTGLILGYDGAIDVAIEVEAGEAVPAGAQFEAAIRHAKTGPVVGSLSTGAGTIARLDGSTLRLTFPAEMTKNWARAEFVMDVVRTDLARPAHMGFEIAGAFSQPVTRQP